MDDIERPTFRGLTSYLHYEDAGAMLDWLSRVFGFEERARYIDSNDRVHEAEMVVGPDEIWMAGHEPGYWDKKGQRPNQLIIVWVEDVDAHHARVTAAGVKAPEPEDKNYDVRTYTVADPEGYQWMFTRRLGKPYQPGPRGLREVRKTSK